MSPFPSSSSIPSPPLIPSLPLSFPQWHLFQHLYHLGPLSIPQLEWYYWYKHHYRMYINMAGSLNSSAAHVSAYPDSNSYSNHGVGRGHGLVNGRRHINVNDHINDSSPPTPGHASAPVHVPPGSGKPSTHSRNRRRRKKRLYEKGVLVAGLNDGVEGVDNDAAGGGVGDGGVNAIPLGVRGAGAGESGGETVEGEREGVGERSPKKNAAGLGMGMGTRTVSGGVVVGMNAVASTSSTPAPSTSSNPTATPSTPYTTSTSTPYANPSSSTPYANPSGVFINPQELMMGSFKNKNKKKGFKMSMGSVIPRKVVWGVEGGQDKGIGEDEVDQGVDVDRVMGVGGEGGKNESGEVGREEGGMDVQGEEGGEPEGAQYVYLPTRAGAAPYETPTTAFISTYTTTTTTTTTPNPNPSASA
ncbi:hypothetical protein CVT24_002464, partial [Panaeolus cyanescens]